MLTINTILLDIDGTLLDFEAAQENALQQTFASHNIPLTKDVRALYDSINHSLWKEYEKGIIDRDTVLYTRFVKLFESLEISCDGIAFEKEYQVALAEGTYLLDGALELVEYLYEKYPLYIVTNGVAATQHKRLQSSGLNRYMKKIFISETIGYQKPQREFFTEIFKQIPEIDPKTTIIIGDTLSADILGGNNAGILTCWYNPKQLPNDLDCKVDLEVQSLQQLLEHF